MTILSACGGWSDDDTSAARETAGPLGRDSVAERLADDFYPALDLELGEDVGDVGLHGPPGQEQAAGDVRRRVTSGDQGGDLGLGGGERVPSEGRARLAVPPDASPDAVRAEPGISPPDIPPGL